MPFGIAGKVEGLLRGGYYADIMHSLANEEKQIEEWLVLEEVGGMGGRTIRKYLASQSATLDCCNGYWRALRVLRHSSDIPRH